jgi:hypothetical protein
MGHLIQCICDSMLFGEGGINYLSELAQHNMFSLWSQLVKLKVVI